MIEMFRLLGAPSKVEFLRNGMNVIDVLAVVPYYVELTMAQVDTSGGGRGGLGHNTTALDTLEVNQLFVNITSTSGSVSDLCTRLSQNKEVNHVQVFDGHPSSVFQSGLFSALCHFLAARFLKVPTAIRAL